MVYRLHVYTGVRVKGPRLNLALDRYMMSLEWCSSKLFAVPYLDWALISGNLLLV